MGRVASVAMAASLDLGDDDSEPMPAAPCSEGSGDEELSGNCSQETVEYIDDWGEAERECEALPGDPVPPGPLLAASFVYHGNLLCWSSGSLCLRRST